MGKSTMRFGEVVLKTNQFEALKSWYSQVLDKSPCSKASGRTQRGRAERDRGATSGHILIPLYRDAGHLGHCWSARE